MRFNKNSMNVALGLALILGLGACKKDDDDKNTDGTNPQDQQFSDGVDPNKPLLVVYGDSLSTGVLANTTLGQTPDNSLALQLTDYVKQQEFSATSFQSNLSNTDLAAATTKDAYGLRASFGAPNGTAAADVGVISYARFGGRTPDLQHMFARWQQDEQNVAKKKPDYIFVMLGGNDFCSGDATATIVDTFKTQVTAIHNESPNAHIVIAPSPPIDQLPAIDFTYGPALQGVTGEEMTCKKFREKICSRVYDDPAAVKQRITEINTGIQQTATDLKTAGANVTFVDGILSWQLAPEDLAVDCFHPSLQGQQKIGQFVKTALGE